MKKKDTFTIELSEVQPTQLYISEKKLNNVLEWIDHGEAYVYDPVPIKKLNNKIIFVDGHTRAFALYRLGEHTIKAIWEEEEWDWQAYWKCVEWCEEASIATIADLDKKVISHSEYEVSWHQRCTDMHLELEKERHLIKTWGK